MKMVLRAVVMSAAFFATAASAQILDLSGRYRCVSLCIAEPPGQFAYITQNGTELNVVNDAGMPSRAWVERPGRIWVDRANQGAIYSPDGLTIQFDRGTVWRRDLGDAYRVPADRYRGRIAPDLAPPPGGRSMVTRGAFDGNWSVRLVTQSGNCDPEYRFGAQINNGSVVYEAGSAIRLQGQVAPNGSVWVNVAAGSQQASGEGRLSQNLGTGTWRGQGTAGACTGVWEAARRG